MEYNSNHTRIISIRIYRLMSNTTKLCLLLFIIFLVVYLLEGGLFSRGRIEPMTEVAAQNQVNNILTSFDNSNGFTSQLNELQKDGQLPGGSIDLSKGIPSGVPPNAGQSSSLLESQGPLLGNPSKITTDSADLQQTVSPTIDPNNAKNQMTTPQNADASVVNYFSKQMENNTQVKDFNVADFLPQEINQEWFNTDLTKAQNEIDQATLIEISRFCQGVDTVGQSMKNASYDIRGNIPNPKLTVSPFLNSSYEPDTNIKSWST